MPGRSSIGEGVVRNDGADKVSGRTLYVDDLSPVGCLYGATVRSVHPHARVLSVARDPTFDWTDVTLVTAADIAGENVVHLMTDDQPALADGLVRHCEEAIALVAAPTRDQAAAAARHVRVTYEPLEPLFDVGLSAGNPVRIYGDDNVFARSAIHKGGRAPSGAATAHFHQGTYRVGHQEQLYVEPQGMLAVPRDDGGITVIGSMQCPYYVERALRRLMGHDRLNVVAAATGGGFGGKEEFPSMVACHAALLAAKSGRPVKLVYRRDEDLRATTKRHPAVVVIRSICSLEGRLLEWHAEIVMDGGAYNTLSSVVLSRAVLHLSGPYACPIVHIMGTVVATNTAPNGAFRGFGAPQAIFAVERHMDRIARLMDIDPVAFRRMNLVKAGDTTATGQELTQPGAHAVVDGALEAALDPLPPTFLHPGGGYSRWKRGRGVAVAFHGCGFTGNGETWIRGRVAVELRGRQVVIHSSSTDIGQGSETTFIQIAAAELGIGLGRVMVAPHDTSTAPDSGPTVASRTCMVVGEVVRRAVGSLRAALQAETGLATVDFDALLAARPTEAPLRVERAHEDDGSLRWDEENYRGDAYPTHAWSCVVIDLDVDLDTGEVLYRRLVSCTDVGRAINPAIVVGQIEGGSVQALGYATTERVVVGSSGVMENDRLSSYNILTALDAPVIVTKLVEIPHPGGPFGAKGIGEISMNGPAAAVASAIESATGAVLDELPMTPERVLAAIDDVGGRRSRRGR